MTDMPQTTNLEAVAKALEVPTVDPAPAPVDVHRERLKSLVNNARAVALDRHRKVRDRQDALMRTIDAKGDQVLHEIDEYCALLASAVDQTDMIDEALGETIESFTTTHSVVAGTPVRSSKNGGKSD